MPIYEYTCRLCGDHTEHLQRMGAEPPGPCPACGGELRRVYGDVGVVFSGWGFSKTDALHPDRGRTKKDFKALKRKADELRDTR